MERLIYIIILIYFLLGGIGFYLINRKKDPSIAKKSYTKYIVYFFIINILFFGITINPVVFQYLVILIIVFSYFELFKLLISSKLKHLIFFIIFILGFTFFSAGLIVFSQLEKGLVLFSFLILSIFDSFSQISGQLIKSRKILPAISPNKTLGGLLGGSIIALISAFLLRKLFDGTIPELLVVSVGIVIFAFIGDIAASLYKRKYKVKDYSNLIPGHGGFLDRFDSLIAGGAWVASIVYILGI